MDARIVTAFPSLSSAPDPAVMSLPATATHRLLREAPALCAVISALHQRGWCDGTGGNFSSVLCPDPLALLMAPSGVDKGSLQPTDLIVVDGEGQVILGEGKPSAETLLHLAIIQTTGAGAVLHTHSQAATLLSQWQLSEAADGFIGTTESEAVAEPADSGLATGLGPKPVAPSPHTAVAPLLPHPEAPSPSSPFPVTHAATLSPRPNHIHQDPQSASQERLALSPQSRSHPLAPSQLDGLSAGQQSTSPALLGHLRLVGLEMLKGLEGIRSHTTPVAIPILANSQDMRELSHAALAHLATAPYGLLIAGHGLYAWGDSLSQARRHLEILEFLLEQHWRQLLLSSVIHNKLR